MDSKNSLFCAMFTLLLTLMGTGIPQQQGDVKRKPFSVKGRIIGYSMRAHLRSVQGRVVSAPHDAFLLQVEQGNEKLGSGTYIKIRKWSYRLRAFRPGLLGTLAGLIFFIIYVLGKFSPSEAHEWGEFSIRFLIAILTILIVGTLLAIFATQYTTPINLQLNRRTALLVEVLITTLCVIVGMYLFFLSISLILLNSPNLTKNVDFLNLLLMPLLLGLLAGAVRAGTIIAFGRLKFSRHFRSKSLNWVVQIASGIMSGFSVMTIILVIYSLSNSSIPREVRIATWLSFLAMAVGLASAFANIDSEAPPNQPIKDAIEHSP